MDMERALKEDWEKRFAVWARAIAVVLIGLALGAAAGSATVWSIPARLPDNARALELAALVTPEAPDSVDGADGPSRVFHEDWPVDGFWNHLLLGHNSEPGVLSVDWLSAPIHPAVARPSLTEVEATLRADGWTVDGLDPLTAHKGGLTIKVRDDIGHRELAVTARPDPTPALPVIAASLAAAGIALAWLLWRRRLMARRRVAGGRVGVAGTLLLMPSTLAVYAAGSNDGWWGEGAPDLWQYARFYVDIMPFGLLMNAAILLLAVDAVLLLVRPKGYGRDDIVLAA